MKVRELIELLSGPDFNPESTVHFAYNYGDHWHTQVAPEIEEAYEGFVIHSAYHDMPKVYRVVERYDEDGEDEKLIDELTPVVILS